MQVEVSAADVDEKRVDQQGRLYVGRDLAGETVEYAIVAVKDDD